MELRCQSKKLAELVEPSAGEGRVEISCRSRFCGHHGDTVVIHSFSTHNGKLLDTKFYKRPHRRK